MNSRYNISGIHTIIFQSLTIKDRKLLNYHSSALEEIKSSYSRDKLMLRVGKYWMYFFSKRVKALR